MGLCECGCGEKVAEGIRFRYMHHTRMLSSEEQSRRGRCNTGDKQRGVATGRGNSYIKRRGRHEHRTIMEEHLGRKLTSSDIVHHINHNNKDNRIENLQLMTRAEHLEHHVRGEGKRES